MDTRSSLARYVVTDVSPARVARVWQGVAERLGEKPPRRSTWFVRAAAVSAVAACAVVGWQMYEGRGTDASVWQNAALSTAGDALAVDLEDGSHIELSAYSRVEVQERRADAVELRLSEGRVACDVVPKPSRRFVVSAGGVQVRVTGTRFSVEFSPERDRVSVEVQRGGVEVRAPGSSSVRRLAAGERLSVAIANVPPPEALAASAIVPKEEPAPPAAAPNGSAVSPATDTPARDNPANADEPSPASFGTSSARELLDQANSARRAGDVSHAAAAYELLLAKYPSDARAGLAAFELGRLRMDRLGNLPGAVNALRQAVALAKDSGFREDAMARLVRAYEGMGAVDRCREAQAAYLKSYPGGVHRTQVAGRCGSRKPLDNRR